MSVVVLKAGGMTITIRNVVRRKSGVFHWRMRVPKGLRGNHGGKSHLDFSLKTKDSQEAAPRASKLTAEHEALWASLRSPEVVSGTYTPQQVRDAAKAQLIALGLQPGGGREGSDGWWTVLDSFEREHGHAFQEARHHDGDGAERRFLTPVNRETERLYRDGEAPKEVTLTDARATYFRLHKEGAEGRFQRDTNLPVDAFMALAGDRPLPSYTRDQANAYRDEMSARGNKSGTVRRRLRVLSAIFNMAKREHSLTMVNPFEGMIIARDGADATPRLPFTLGELRTLMAACRKADDDRRHILSIQLDTGARLSEIVGLRREDVFLSDAVPHIIIRDHRDLGRRVKTAVSNRRVPLVGEALWGATRAMAEAAKAQGHGEWLFPRYASDGEVKGNHASGALNKWMRTLPGVEGTTHSFRHAMRDRMREAGIPEDIRDAIDGHGTKSVGERYGSGHSLKLLRDHMVKVVISPDGTP
ncbi:DUF6538 domain-containing protein [Lichenibacterium ramalinae]|uniref:Integrase n=1 Tax=Lichenibacterium ramalinae TaxID=2316527 RepID=A0A4Q2RIM7_9HYPH|nr:integrase [Lichenibacterium ramalinae]